VTKQQRECGDGRAPGSVASRRSQRLTGTLYYCVADRVTAINPSGSGLDAHAGAKVHRT
jgi:hypothetical protein